MGRMGSFNANDLKKFQKELEKLEKNTDAFLQSCQKNQKKVRNDFMSEKAKKWCKAAGIRAVKTVAQNAVALIPAAATIVAVDWKVVLGTAVLAGVNSLLTSLAGLPEVPKESEESK